MSKKIKEIVTALTALELDLEVQACEARLSHSPRVYVVSEFGETG
jgi:hypothetical protein